MKDNYEEIPLHIIDNMLDAALTTAIETSDQSSEYEQGILAGQAQLLDVFYDYLSIHDEVHNTRYLEAVFPCKFFPEDDLWLTPLGKNCLETYKNMRSLNK